MNNTKLILIAGRSLKQGTGLNIGKESADYQDAVNRLEMNRDDMLRLGLKNGDKARVKAAGAAVVVHCQEAELPAGMAFIAYGPASSELMEQETHGSGMPSSKGFEVEVERVS